MFFFLSMDHFATVNLLCLEHGAVPSMWSVCSAARRDSLSPLQMKIMRQSHHQKEQCQQQAKGDLLRTGVRANCLIHCWGSTRGIRSSVSPPLSLGLHLSLRLLDLRRLWLYLWLRMAPPLLISPSRHLFYSHPRFRQELLAIRSHWAPSVSQLHQGWTSTHLRSRFAFFSRSGSPSSLWILTYTWLPPGRWSC